MTTYPRKPLPTGPHHCEAVAETLVGHFAARLEAEARKSGGLDAAAIRALADSFIAADSKRFGPIYQRSYEECSQARDLLLWEKARRNPFDRVLVRKFGHLFPARPGDDGSRDGGLLSRRVVAGFVKAVNMMIGPVLYDQCQRKCQAILERHRTEAVFDWAGVYDDDEAIALTNDVLVVMSHYFSDFEKRRAWFITVVNSHLGAPEQDQPGDEDWQLDDAAFHQMMLALFEDLRHGLAKGSRALRSRYGENTLDSLAAFFARLEGEQASV